MSDRRVLGFVWLVAAVCLLLVLRDLLQWAFAISGVANPELLGRTTDVASLAALGLSAITAVLLWRQPKVYEFCIEVVAETRKVVWPTRQETRDHTVVVVITSMVFALLLWGFDQVWKKLFALLLDLDA
jgi:preprotein translocase SecE subunit